MGSLLGCYKRRRHDVEIVVGVPSAHHHLVWLFLPSPAQASSLEIAAVEVSPTRNCVGRQARRKDAIDALQQAREVRQSGDGHHLQGRRNGLHVANNLFPPAPPWRALVDTRRVDLTPVRTISTRSGKPDETRLFRGRRASRHHSLLQAPSWRRLVTVSTQPAACRIRSGAVFENGGAHAFLVLHR